MAEQEKPESKPVDLAVVSLATRIPDFWIDQPRIWFLQTDAILAPQHMADNAKFNLVVTKLGKEVIQQVTDILIKPPATGKYEAIKSRLLQIYEESANRQVQKLISEMELGEQKPSQLLRRMRELATGKIEDDTLAIMWQGHLPAPVRAVLAATDIKELDTLASVADKVMETTKPMFVSEVASTSNRRDQAEDSNMDKILKEIAKISLKVNNLENERYRSRSRSRSRSNGPYTGRRNNSRDNRRSPESPDWLCFYHFRFRDRAAKCVEPCNWKTKEN